MCGFYTLKLKFDKKNFCLNANTSICREPVISHLAIWCDRKTIVNVPLPTEP